MPSREQVPYRHEQNHWSPSCKCHGGLELISFCAFSWAFAGLIDNNMHIAAPCRLISSFFSPRFHGRPRLIRDRQLLEDRRFTITRQLIVYFASKPGYVTEQSSSLLDKPHHLNEVFTPRLDKSTNLNFALFETVKIGVCSSPKVVYLREVHLSGKRREQTLLLRLHALCRIRADSKQDRSMWCV